MSIKRTTTATDNKDHRNTKLVKMSLDDEELSKVNCYIIGAIGSSDIYYMDTLLATGVISFDHCIENISILDWAFKMKNQEIFELIQSYKEQDY